MMCWMLLGYALMMVRYQWPNHRSAVTAEAASWGFNSGSVRSSKSRCVPVDGTKTERKVWGGRAHLEELEADGPTGHWEGLTLFLYNPDSRQWTQAFINGKVGVIKPPLVGAFKDGRGEFFQQDSYNN